MKQKHYIYQQGGLGNQLYILAYADYFKRKTGIENIAFYSPNKAQKDTKNKHQRNVYQEITEKLGFNFLNTNYFIFSLIKKLIKKGIFTNLIELHAEKKNEWAVFAEPKLNYTKKYNLHEGWYQSYLYQTPEFIKKLRQIIQELANFAKFSITENDVVVHIRRGDFLKPQFINTYNIINTSHYLKGLEMMAAKIHIGKVYIMSDDFGIIWEDITKISEKYEVVLVEGNSVLEDISLLTNFKNFVIGNSTFSWWGAYLSDYDKDVNVIVPQEPWKIPMPEKTPYHPHWIQI